MGLHYGFWNIMLLFPVAIRLLIEILVVTGIILVFWPVLKYILVALVQIGIGLNYFILGGLKRILPMLPWKGKYVWDEKMAKRGGKNDIWLREKRSGIRKSKIGDVLKKKTLWVIICCFYVVAILPVFQLGQFIPKHFIDGLYSVNRFFVSVETKLTAGIEDYPPFWIKDEEEAVGTAAAYEEDSPVELMEPIPLELDKNVSYANVRESADMQGDRICIISREDEILYQHIYEYDEERYWLKVTLPSQANVEGWISAKVIAPEIVETLDLRREGE